MPIDRINREPRLVTISPDNYELPLPGDIDPDSLGTLVALPITKNMLLSRRHKGAPLPLFGACVASWDGPKAFGRGGPSEVVFTATEPCDYEYESGILDVATRRGKCKTFAMSLLYVPLPKPQTVRLMADGDPVPILGQTLVSDMYHLGEFLCDGICYGSVERFKLGKCKAVNPRESKAMFRTLYYYRPVAFYLTDRSEIYKEWLKEEYLFYSMVGYYGERRRV